MSATSLYKLEKLYFFLAFFREPLATRMNESSRREQRPSVFYNFFLAFAVFCEQKATGINRSRLREQRPSVVYYFFLAFAVFLAGAFFAEALQADLQNFT